ncbi:MAG: type I phosphomannose isomerase catalytic subunit [Trueperaceae bacterium]|nr:type I phosphomannose isomerase catalytic subunit [Trueperaceae bacterium]
MESLPPLRLRPAFHRRLWGGDTLPAWLNEVAPPGDDQDEPVGEAWIANGDSVIVDGPFDGLRLAELITRYGPAVVGEASVARYGEVMPLLAKFLDAAADLSVQVHPDDAYAARRHPGSGHLGKTESWRVQQVASGASIVWGFERPVTEEQVRRALQDGTIADLLRTVPVRTGDVVHNPAGTVHAVGAGVRLYELQQASDLTYRLWDHDRRGADGRPRELHVEDALAVADLSGRGDPLPAPRPGPDGWTVRVDCPFYRLEEATTDGTASGRTDPVAMHVVTVLNGTFELEAGVGARIHLAEGATAVVPAATGPYGLTGRGTVVRGRPVPDRR